MRQATLYKLTTQNGTTHNGITWAEGVTHTAAEGDPVLCTATVIHAYRSPEIAVFANPIHAKINNPMLWKCKGLVKVEDSLKVRCSKLTTLCTVPLPRISTEQRVEVGIRIAHEVYEDDEWRKWADEWLDGTNRSVRATVDAADAANDNACAAYAANTNAYAARAAADAAYAANANVCADYAADAANAANADAYVARAARAAANAAVNVADAVDVQTRAFTRRLQAVLDRVLKAGPEIEGSGE